MSPSPSMLMCLIVILSATLGLVLVAQAFLWGRLRRLGLALARIGDQLEALAKRQAAPEGLVSQAQGAAGQPQDGHAAASNANANARRAHPRAPSLRRSPPVHRVDPAEPNAMTGPTLISVPSLVAHGAASESAVGELGRRFGPIWDQADGGATPDAIARTTGQPVGQIELILALRRQLAAQAGEPRPT